MDARITLENVHTFSVPLSQHSLRWIFEQEDSPLSAEFQDQIVPLTAEAARFLWNFRSPEHYVGSFDEMGKYFKEHAGLANKSRDNQQLKKWLYARGIPFDRKVFWSTQPEEAFVLSWKMVIKFSARLFFANDEVIWDKSLNWVLVYDHNDVFHFGRQPKFNIETHSQPADRTS